MCLWAIVATLGEKWKVNVWPMLQSFHLPLVQESWEPWTYKNVLADLQSRWPIHGGDCQTFLWAKSDQHVLPTAWSSGKLHAVTSGTLEITSVRTESLLPYSVDKGLAPKPAMWSLLPWESGHGKFFWKGVWWAFLRVTVQLGLGFGTSSHELDCGSCAPQGLRLGSSRGVYTCLQGLMLFLSGAPWIMEFYWCASEGWFAPGLLLFSSILPRMHLSIRLFSSHLLVIMACSVACLSLGWG